MLLCCLKPSVGSLPSSYRYRFNGPTGTGPPVSAIIRVNANSTTLQLKGGEGKLQQAQETQPAVLRRDVIMLLSAAVGLGLSVSLPTPAEALQGSIFAGILEARREARRVKPRFLKPKPTTEVDKKAKNESKAELPNAKNEVEQGKENQVNGTGNDDEKPKAESDGEAAKKPRGDAPPLLPLPNLLNGTPMIAIQTARRSGGA